MELTTYSRVYYALYDKILPVPLHILMVQRNESPWLHGLVMTGLVMTGLVMTGLVITGLVIAECPTVAYG